MSLGRSAKIIATLANGAAKVIPTPEIQSGIDLKKQLGPDSILGGERKGIIIPGYDQGNSPREYTRELVAGREVILCTSNGTVAMESCRGARRVLMGAFVNLGAVAESFDARQLSFVMRWEEPGLRSELPVFAIAHWEFLFIISALLGLYVLHRLSRVVESGEVDERFVVQEFAIEAARSVDSLSSIGGALGFLFPFRRFVLWRTQRLRGEPARRAEGGWRGR